MGVASYVSIEEESNDGCEDKVWVNSRKSSRAARACGDLRVSMTVGLMVVDHHSSFGVLC